MTDVNSDPCDWAEKSKVNQDNEVRSYAEATNGPVPQNVPQSSILTHDEDVRTTMFADNNLPKRPCSFFFKLAFQALNMRSLFQDLSWIGILPSSFWCLQTVSKGSYVITSATQRIVKLSLQSQPLFPVLKERLLQCMFMMLHLNYLIKL